jgi:hypothetical protein
VSASPPSIYDTGRPNPGRRRHRPPQGHPTGVSGRHERVSRDRIDDSGVVTIRYHGRLHHIGVGRTQARTPVLLLIQDRHIRVINETTGEVLRDLVLDPTGDYQRQPRRSRATDRTRRFGLSPMS